MAQARRSGSSNQKKGSRASGARASQQKQAPAFQKGTATSDIAGLALIVIAVAMLIAIFAPSQAPLTRATGEFLELCFGVGAPLLPVAMIVFALTFFADEDEGISGRVAGGLALVVLAILGLISLAAPGAGVDASVVLDELVVVSHGGYVGGGIAWTLLTFVGLSVGVTILVGVAIAGAIICGFSISGLVARIRGKGEERRARREQARAEREAEEERAAQAARAASVGAYGLSDQAAQAPAAGSEAPTTFLGARKTSVLKRGGAVLLDGDGAKEAAGETVVLDDVPTKAARGSKAKTIRLSRKRHPALDADVAVPASEDAVAAGKPGGAGASEAAPAAEADVRPSGKDSVAADDGASQEPNIPGFLQAQAGKGSSRAADSSSAGDAKPAKRSRRRPTKRQDVDAAGAQSATQRALAFAAAAPTLGTPAKAASANDVPADAEAAVAPAVAKEHVRQASAPAARPGDGDDDYKLPPFSMLSSNPNSAASASSREEIQETMERLQGTLKEFGLTARVVDYVTGPLVTTFRIEMGEGERVNRIKNLEDDIALTLAAESVRIFAPIPGTSLVGIEIPNKKRENVHLGDVLPYAKGGPLEVAIGRDSGGKPVVADIARMPHMLVAGTTGSGKSVMINSMIMSILMRATPKQVRLILVDPKRVEFPQYNGIPHLYVPVVTEPRQAASALQWAVSEMERRLKLFERAGARDIKVYNRMCTTGKLSEMEHPPEPLPYLVVIIDELSDLMMVAGKDVEASIVRIAQLARAAGIHLVIATQRPSADVVTGLIKSNIDNRVALKVATGIDSRVILDETGAERLLGNGDMLFKYRGVRTRRVLGCYTSDEEINNVVEFIKSQGEPEYHTEILSAVVPGQPSSSSGGGSSDEDPLLWEAAQIVVDSQLGSTSGLQRRLKVGYARAGRIMDMLEEKGVVGPPDGSKPREVLLDKDGLEELRVQEEKYREV